MRPRILTALLGLLMLAAGADAGPPIDVSWLDATTLRLPVPPNDPAVTSEDPDQKDFAWGDVDRDGDVDLICVRKQPFTTPGRRRNVLYLNEGTSEGHPVDGVLVDRTLEYASASDVVDDQGFLTPTNDRDVALADVDGDGWLDIITATTLSDGEPKHISHPRVYMNLGLVEGSWAGFRHEDWRIPGLHPTAAPRFRAVAAGDLTGDGLPELCFFDSDLGGPQTFDFNNRLLLNLGDGSFADVTDAAFTPDMADSSLNAEGEIVDMDGDGINDIVKLSGGTQPHHIAVIRNDGAVFTDLDVVYNFAQTFVSVGDLNRDELPDLVVTDDGTDRYLLNRGVDGDDALTFRSLAFPFASNGFGGNSVVADLDRDGWNDVIIADVDSEIPGCSRALQLYRNGAEGDTPTFSEWDAFPSEEREGSHDVAVFDIDGDGWLDLVLGRCSSTQIWIAQPPLGIDFVYPEGLPDLIEPGTMTTFSVQMTGVGDDHVAGTGALHFSVNDGPFDILPMSFRGGDSYTATLPPFECGDRVRFWVSGDLAGGASYSDPPGAPQATYGALVADALAVAFETDFERDDAGWTIENDAALVSGAWERAEPVGTLYLGEDAAPEGDATVDGSFAFVTQNGTVGGTAGESDVDGGPTRLLSPVQALEGDAVVSFERWMFTGNGVVDELVVEVSTDGGGAWLEVTDLRTSSANAWERVSFVVGDWAPLGSTLQVRFTVADVPNDSVTEAGIDGFRVESIVCLECSADVDGDGAVGVNDLLQLLGRWGPCPGCAADLTGDGVVGVDDLLAVLAGWGGC